MQEIWIIIAIMAVSFFILTKLPSKLWGGGRFGAMVAEGFSLVVAFFVSMFRDDSGDAFKVIAVLSVIVFAAIFTLIGKKQGSNIVAAIIVGIIQSVLSLFGGVIILFAAGNKSQSQSAPTSQQESVINPLQNADLERAEWDAKLLGYNSADDWAKQNGYGTASDAYNNGYIGNLHRAANAKRGE